jgi:P27 family predicted phage terminase small subunit
MPTPRKPTVLQINEGDRSKKGRKRLAEQLASEPKMTPGAPAMPRGLSSSSQRMWRQWIADLDRDGLLATVDEGALEAGFRGRDQALAADARIAKLQKTIRSGKAEQQDYYQLSILNAVSKKGWQQFKAMASEFGGSPAARSRLKVEKPDDELKRIEEALSKPRARAV